MRPGGMAAHTESHRPLSFLNAPPPSLLPCGLTTETRISPCGHVILPCSINSNSIMEVKKNPGTELGGMVTRSHSVLLHRFSSVKKSKKERKKSINFEGEVPKKFCALLTEGKSSFLGVFLRILRCFLSFSSSEAP